MTACHDSYEIPPAATTAKVVVGVDGSPNSIAALRRAAAEADRLGATLTVVFAYHLPLSGYSFSTFAAPPDRLDSAAAAARGVLADCMEDAFGPARPADVRLLAVPGTASAVLTDLASDADLLVVGAKGHSAAFRLLLGSTTQACALHAPCPVLVVPAETGRRRRERIPVAAGSTAG